MRTGRVETVVPYGGTEVSNPSPSRRESTANLTSEGVTGACRCISSPKPVARPGNTLSVYSQTPRERLLEFLSGHPNIEAFRQLPQLELAKICAEGIANNIRTATRK